MTEVERLLAEYKEAHAGGGDADPRPFLERLPPGADRELLAGLIDAYLARAPRRRVDAAELSAPGPAHTAADDVQRSLSGSSGLWPALLPRLRDRARLRRAELVSQLAARLGAQGQREKVGLYYHRMEQGLLPEAGVSDAVLEALGRIVGHPGTALRNAGRVPAAGPPRADEGAAFARAAYGEPAEPGAPAPPEEWDEVDRLFRGGP